MRIASAAPGPGAGCHAIRHGPSVPSEASPLGVLADHQCRPKPGMSAARTGNQPACVHRRT
jgi:hypothetical protein